MKSVILWKHSSNIFLKGTYKKTFMIKYLYYHLWFVEIDWFNNPFCLLYLFMESLYFFIESGRMKSVYTQSLHENDCCPVFQWMKNTLLRLQSTNIMDLIVVGKQKRPIKIYCQISRNIEVLFAIIVKKKSFFFNWKIFKEKVGASYKELV